MKMDSKGAGGGGGAGGGVAAVIYKNVNINN